MSALTHPSMAANLCPSLQQVAVGNRRSCKATIGHFLQWFFCTHQIYNLILLWMGFIEQTLKSLAAPWRYVELDNTPSAQHFDDVDGGLFFFTRNHHA